MKRILTFGFGALLLVSLFSCGPVIQVMQLSSSSFPPKSTEAPISVFMTKPPRCPYKEIAIITTSEGAFAGGLETFVEAMKVKARLLGADALLLGEVGTRTEGYVAVAPNTVVAAEGKTLTAVAIKFLSQDCID